MSGVPYTFATATTSIPLSQLDANFATNATIGTTSVGLGNTTATLVGLTNVSTTVVNTSNVASNTSLLLQTNGTTTAVTIDNSGNLLVGTNGISTGTFAGLQNGTTNSVTGNYLSHNPSGTSTRNWSFGHNSSDQYIVYGYNNTSFNSGAYIAWGGTSWTASSDERKKDIIEPISDAISKVEKLRAVIGKYKTDEQGKRRAFLIAQDVLSVLPEAVDASDADNLGVQYTEVIPLLVASIKELSAKVTALQETVAALQAKVGA